MRSNLRIIFLLFKVIVSIASFGIERSFTISDEQNVHFLTRNSFTIRSAIRRLGGHSFVLIHLKERYSFEQKRARITYKVGGNVESDFIYEAATGASIDYKVLAESCKGSSLNDLFHQLYQPDAELMLDLVTSPSEHNHIVGPAKLLSIVCTEANELVQNYWPAGERKMRNLSTIEFMLRIKTNLAKFDALMIIYYNYDTFSEDKICELLPLQIYIKFPDKGHSIVVDYFEYEIDTIIDESSFNGDTNMDSFAFPVGLDCSFLLESKVDMFSEAKLNRFSFEASVSWFSDPPMKYFVAYDKHRDSMRINVDDNEADSSTLTLLDFNLRRTFTCFNGNCFTTETNQATAPKPSLTQLLLGSSEPQLIYMGRALVRNIETQVYEVLLGDTLPLWFMQPVMVEHGQDKKFRHPGRTLDRFSTGIYVLTVFMAADKSTNDLQILQLEIHDLNQQPSLACILKAELYNFQNALTTAAADNERNIFSIDLEGNSVTKVELLLAQDVDLNLERDYKWINNWATRYDAILTSLSESLELPTVFIRELESKLDKSTIELSFELTGSSQQKLYTFSYLGQFELNKEVDLENFIQVKAKTLSGCLELLTRCRLDKLPMYLFYSERTKRCLMNMKMTYDDSSGCSLDLRQLKYVFYPNLKGLGEIFMIEWQPDLAYKKHNSLVEGNSIRQLEESTMTLRNPVNDESEELQLDIKRVKVDKNLPLGGGSPTLAGLGLPVQASVTEVTDQLVNSLQQCEAACLRDINCRIYSYCLKNGQVQCRLSSVSTSDDQILNEQLKEARDLSMEVLLLSSKKKLKLERDIRCQLSQKLYLDLFIKRPPREIYITSYEIISVSSRERCAELCFFRNFKALQESSDQNFCRSFNYLDSSTLNDWQNQALKLVENNQSDEHLLCLIDSNVEMDLSQRMTKNNYEFVRRTLFKPEFFKFDFTTLYEQTFGIALVDSSKESFALNEHSKNAQTTTMDRLNDCAEKCFLQPACNSFDYISGTKHLQYQEQNLCHLNTLSLYSVGLHEREKLVSSNKQRENVNKRHFEPRFHNNDQPRTHPVDNFKSQSHSLLIWLVTFSSTISGIVLAYQLDRRLKLHLPNNLDPQSMDIQLTQQ